VFLAFQINGKSAKFMSLEAAAHPENGAYYASSRPQKTTV
jgi:hypothetical protein